jgi:hypothetical protein
MVNPELEWERAWLAAHPGRTATEYSRMLKDPNSDAWNWRHTIGKAHNSAERKAWRRDHPGEEYPVA